MLLNALLASGGVFCTVLLSMRNHGEAGKTTREGMMTAQTGRVASFGLQSAGYFVMGIRARAGIILREASTRAQHGPSFVFHRVRHARPKAARMRIPEQ